MAWLKKPDEYVVFQHQGASNQAFFNGMTTGVAREYTTHSFLSS
jgi:hypothetical protein